MLLGAVVFFLANHVLAGTGAALLARTPVVPYLLEDLAFQAVTEGCLLAFAPAIVAAAQVSVALVPLAFCPTLAIYFGGREAADAGHRAVARRAHGPRQPQPAARPPARAPSPRPSARARPRW